LTVETTDGLSANPTDVTISGLSVTVGAVGGYVFRAVVEDVAGNTAEAGTVGMFYDNMLPVTDDLLLSVTSVTTGAADSSTAFFDSGSSNSDRRTRDGQFALSFTGISAGDYPNTYTALRGYVASLDGAALGTVS
jgi:hypothetical protein